MPPPRHLTVDVACPKCGHVQPEPPSAYSTICKGCQRHFLVQEALRPKPRQARQEVEHRQVRCFQCGADLEVPIAAASTMCRRCSSHVDLADYHVTQTVSKNFRTHGRLVVEEKGYVLNTDALVGAAVIKGRVIGRLASEGTLEIHSSARIKGTLAPGTLVVPAGHHFHWPEPLQAGAAEIAGEWAGTLLASGTVRLRATARFFGDIRARGLVVEAGAVFVGAAHIQPSAEVKG